MPELLTEMRRDLAEHPVAREFIVKTRASIYNGRPGQVMSFYTYEDHADLDAKLRVLESCGLIRDITYTNAKRYVMTEEFARYLGDARASTRGLGKD